METNGVSVVSNILDTVSVLGEDAGDEVSSMDTVFLLKVEELLGVGGGTIVDGEISDSNWFGRWEWDVGLFGWFWLGERRRSDGDGDGGFWDG